MFPQVVSHNTPLQTAVEDIRSSVKFQLKKVTCLATAVGSATMTDDELRSNIMMSINFLVSLLKKGWHNLKSVNIKSTMSPAIKLLWALILVIFAAYSDAQVLEWTALLP